jgi:predicted Zn-dependent peptidase
MYKLITLDNRFRVATESMSHMESVALGVWIRAGGRYENTQNSGISHLLEHLLFKGTEKRDMITIKQEIEGRGGSFNGFTSEDHTCYLVKVLAKDTELGIDILSDMVQHPRLAPEEIEKEKNVVIEEINMYRDMPHHYVHEILADMMWQGQPLGMPLAGTVESVRSITKPAILSYKRDHYSSANMLLAGAGLINEEELARLSKKYFKDSLPEPDTAPFEAARVSQAAPSLRIKSKETEQTHIALGLHTIDRFHPDRFALTLLNIILGANMSSRLFHIIRDEMALCYEISSNIRRYEDCGAVVISAGVDHEKLIRALEAVLKELSRLKSEPVTADEIKRAKEYYRGQLAFALEDTMSHMLWLGEKIIMGEKDFSPKSIIRNIEAVSAEDIMRVAGGLFRNDNLNLAVISPAKEEGRVKEALAL